MHMAMRSLLSDEEFLALPDAPGKQELLDGELIELPPAKIFHSKLAKRLMWLLITVVDKSRIWIEVVYWMRKGRWLIPDLSVSWPDQGEKDGWFEGSPMMTRQSDNVPFEQSRNVLLTAPSFGDGRRTAADDAS